MTPKKLLRKLHILGFEIDHTTGSHTILYQPQTKRRAVVPNHLKDIPKGTVSSILREAGISREEIVRV